VGFGLKPYVQCMYKSLVVYVCWSVSVYNSLGSLGETFTLLVGVHGGVPSV